MLVYTILLLLLLLLSSPPWPLRMLFKKVKCLAGARIHSSTCKNMLLSALADSHNSGSRRGFVQCQNKTNTRKKTTNQSKQQNPTCHLYNYLKL